MWVSGRAAAAILAPGIAGVPRLVLARLGATAPDLLDEVIWPASALTRVRLWLAVEREGRFPLVARWWPPADSTPRRRRPQETEWRGRPHLPQ